MHRFKELEVWKKSIELTEKIYIATSLFPPLERYGLRQQMNRCVISIASNIAEGSGRNTNRDFAQFLSISIGSSFELETQLIVCSKLNYLKPDVINNAIIILKEIQNMLFSLRRYVLRKDAKENTIIAFSLFVCSIIAYSWYFVLNT